MGQSKQEKNLANPLTGAASIGFTGGLCTAIGASLTDRSVHAEAMTALVGGVITGAIAGSIGCCLTSDNASFSIKMTLSLLSLGASFAAPAMGELVMGLGTEYRHVIVDELIGASTILGAGVALAVGAGALYGIGYAGSACYSRFFSPLSVDEQARQTEQSKNSITANQV